MKQLEIKTNKRLLIVEMTGELDTADVFSWNNQPVEKICKGSDLTEDIVEELVEEFEGSFIPQYKNYQSYEIIFEAMDSFITAVNASGYHWGENPVKTMHFDGTRDEYWKAINDAESRTFNPEKCIIYEIA